MAIKTDTESLKKLQKAFKNRYGIELHIHPDPYHRTDCSYIKDGKIVEVEVKCRRLPSTRYPDFILSRPKFEYISHTDAALAYMYDDGFIWIRHPGEAAVKNQDGSVAYRKVWHQKTQDFADKSYIEEDCAVFTLEDKKLLPYE